MLRSTNRFMSKSVGGHRSGHLCKEGADFGAQYREPRIAGPEARGPRTGAGAVTKTPSKPAPPMPQRRPPEPDYDTGSRTGADAMTEDRKSGGRAGSDQSPFSSALKGTAPKGRSLDKITMGTNV